jgi:N-acetyltransferase 10
MTMDCHERFRTDGHSDVIPRFNERFILGLSQCNACLVLDDELNILPLSSKFGGKGGGDGQGSSSSSGGGKLALRNVDASCSSDEVAAAVVASEAGNKELAALVRSLADTQPAGALVSVCKTLDQVGTNEGTIFFAFLAVLIKRAFCHYNVLDFMH